MQQANNKKIIMKAAAKILKELKGTKSNYLLGMEYDISTSLLNHIERGIKDPQLTTIFKLSQALGVKASGFVRMVEDILPENFSMFDE